MVDIIVGGLRDCVFFLVVGFLGFHKVIGEPILAALLSAYTAHRFGVSMGKQQAVIALNNGSSSGSSGGGTGTSGTMRAVGEPQPTSTSPTRRVPPVPPIPRTDYVPQLANPMIESADPFSSQPESDPDGHTPTVHREASLSMDTGAYQIVATHLGGIA